MKSIQIALLTIISFALVAPAFAQNNGEDKFGNTTETLFSGNGGTKLGFMASAYYNVSGFDGDAAHVGGGKLGVILGKSLTIGAFGQSSGEIRPESETNLGSRYLDMRSAGGFIEYTLFPDKVVHFTFPLLIGAGEVEWDTEMGSAGLSEENFLYVEPRALVEVNLHKYVKLNAGLGYRWVSDMAYGSLTEQDIRSLTGTIGLKIGLFR